MQLSADQLVRLARRDNNPVRPYLFVNPLQGKHIPTDPLAAEDLCRQLAGVVRAAYPAERLYVIGFAETATGVAASVCSFLPGVRFYQHTTRENHGEESLLFSESHSHASDQFLRTAGVGECLDGADRVLFLDDEVTTGNTICNLIRGLRERFGAERTEHLKFSIVSILNSMAEDRMRELRVQGVDCLFLCRIPFEYGKDRILDVPEDPKLHQRPRGQAVPGAPLVRFRSPVNPRNAVDFASCREAAERFAETVLRAAGTGEKGSRILVLGTEEFMYPTFVLGRMLREAGAEVRIHSTTRSPIIASDRPGYPLTARYELRSAYDPERRTFLYNLEPADRVFILTDAPEQAPGLGDLYEALRMRGSTNTVLAVWQYAE